MCGIAPSREVVEIPVIGAFRASAYTAMMLSERFSIITILDGTGFMGIAEPVSKMISDKYGGYVPVMDPNMTAFSYLMLLVRNGYKQSRLCYSKPADDPHRS